MMPLFSRKPSHPTPGMVRLRLINLHPDFSTPTASSTVWQMPSWASVSSSLDNIPFEMRYLIEALVSHGTVTVPEVGDLLCGLRRYRSDDRLDLLEGLFKWTRRGSIDTDLRREFSVVGVLNIPDLSLYSH